MDIINALKEAKRRTNLMNSISLDWPHAQQLLPKVLNQSTDYTDDFKENVRIVTYLLDDIEENIRQLKDILPRFEKEV